MMTTLLDENPWNSLEVMKLLIGGLTPIIVILFGLFLNRKLKQFEHKQWRNQKLIEKRIAIYDQIAPYFNAMLCYYTYVGDWKKCEPIEIVKMKRALDKQIYLSKAIFSETFFSKSMAFIDNCFKSHQGWGVDAKLLTDFDRRKSSFGEEWKTEWEKLFTDVPSDIASTQRIKESYSEVMDALANDMGIK